MKSIWSDLIRHWLAICCRILMLALMASYFLPTAITECSRASNEGYSMLTTICRCLLHIRCNCHWCLQSLDCKGSPIGWCCWSCDLHVREFVAVHVHCDLTIRRTTDFCTLCVMCVCVYTCISMCVLTCACIHLSSFTLYCPLHGAEVCVCMMVTLSNTLSFALGWSVCIYDGYPI